MKKELVATGTQSTHMDHEIVNNDKLDPLEKIKHKARLVKRIENEALEAYEDQLRIRTELRDKESDYAVRSKLNQDIMDRAGLKPVERTESVNLNLNMGAKVDKKTIEIKDRFEDELYKQLCDG